jgi:large subunit ribosomal protein L23
MNQERLMKVLLSPHVSEKSSRLADSSNQITFKVLPDATKLEIKKAVELLFDVKVEAVQTANVKGKKKRFSFSVGRRKDWKKAYVTLAEGHDIDFMGAESA